MPQSESKHPRQSTCGNMSDAAREQFLDIKDELELAFKKLARKNKIKVVRGQRGNIPRAYHAVDCLLRVWNGLAPEFKNEHIHEYAASYLETIKTLSAKTDTENSEPIKSLSAKTDTENSEPIKSLSAKKNKKPFKINPSCPKCNSKNTLKQKPIKCGDTDIRYIRQYKCSDCDEAFTSPILLLNDQHAQAGATDE